MAWLSDLLKQTKNLESPQSYFYWSVLTTISASVAKRVWLDRGGVYKLYPNVYTFLISKKSGLRKGVPVNVAKKLAYDLGKIRVIDGQNSIQGVLKDLSKVKTVSKNCVIKDAQGFLITGEFASFMLQDGIGFSLTTLTDLYDAQYHENGFRKRLASQEELELKNPCLTGLFASNETHFFDAVPRNAISGGFLARTFCIYEEKRIMFNSLTGHTIPIPESIDYSRITGHLDKLASLSGQFITEPECLRVYDEWYYDFCKRDLEIEDETGTSERLGDNIWKAAMLIALANNSELIITANDVREAIEKTTETFTNLSRLLLGGSDNKNLRAITMKIITTSILESSPEFEVSRKKVLRKGVGVFGVYDLDECVEHLLQAGMIRINKRGQDVFYKLSEIAIRRHMEIGKANKHVN